MKRQHLAGLLIAAAMTGAEAEDLARRCDSMAGYVTPASGPLRGPARHFSGRRSEDDRFRSLPEKSASTACLVAAALVLWRASSRISNADNISGRPKVGATPSGKIVGIETSRWCAPGREGD